MRKLTGIAIICLSIFILASMIVAIGCGGKSAAEKGAEEQTCHANMKTVRSASNIYAASNDGTYPGDMSDLVPEFIETTPTCPSGGNIDWGWDSGAGGSPPSPSCDIHGTI